MKVAIVGGGIVALSTALHFQKEFRDAKISVFATSFEDTTSHVAAGIFRVAESFFGPSDQITWQWIKDSYEYYNDILKSDEASLAGVTSISGYMFAKSSPNVLKNYWMEKLLPTYRRVTPEEFNLVQISSRDHDNTCWKYGTFFTTLLVDSRLHLPWLRKRLKAYGTSLIKETVNSLPKMSESYDLIINCSGLGARELCNDRHLIPIRGQVIMVRAPWIKNFFYGETDSYIIPGFNGLCTLGGTRSFDSSNKEICPYDKMKIWEKCSQMIPSLSKASIISHATGLRPHREGGVRVEMEQLFHGFSKKMIIHNYGHGGYGISTSPGTAKYTVQLASEVHRMTSRL